MRWDDLQAFLAVAHAGQLSRAAQKLEIDATTVGRRLRRLERSLGVSLLDSSRQGQSLTKSGADLLERVEAMAEIAAPITPGDATGSAVTGRIRVSVSEGFGTWFVAHHLGRFAGAYPDLAVDLVASNGFLNPLSGETDVAVMLARPRKGALVTGKLGDYRLRVYAAQRYLANNPAIETLSQLAGHVLIGYIPDFIYAPELEYLSDLVPGLEPRLRSSSINAQYRLAAAGAGIAVLPCFIGDADPSLQVILPDVAITRSFWLVTHQETRHARRIKVFVQWLTALMQEHRRPLLGATG